jgi:hypothetical protein
LDQTVGNVVLRNRIAPKRCSAIAPKIRRARDPTITLKHYQKSVPASVKAAAIMLENDLFGDHSERVLSGSNIQ